MRILSPADVAFRIFCWLRKSVGGARFCLQTSQEYSQQGGHGQRATGNGRGATGEKRGQAQVVCSQQVRSLWTDRKCWQIWDRSGPSIHLTCSTSPLLHFSPATHGLPVECTLSVSADKRMSHPTLFPYPTKAPCKVAIERSSVIIHLCCDRPRECISKALSKCNRQEGR